MTTNKLYLLNCITHMHVGSGDSNYGVIDKLIQRDPTSDNPSIYASSLKGAFREYYKSTSPTDTDAIFGKENKSSIVFHQASLISLPVRSNVRAFYSMTSPMAINEILNQMEIMGIANTTLIAELTNLKNAVQLGKAIVINDATSNICIEDFETPINTTLVISHNLKSILGENIVLVDDEQWIEYVSDYRLPVIARNNLENGQSKNLWYEQIIPRASKFVFACNSIPGHDCTPLFAKMDNNLRLQIGANATIGYGLCNIVNIL